MFIYECAILFVLLQQTTIISSSSIHFPGNYSRYDEENTNINYNNNNDDGDTLQYKSDDNVYLQERSFFGDSSYDVGTLSRGSDPRETMILKSDRFNNQQEMVRWPSSQKKIPETSIFPHRSKRSIKSASNSRSRSPSLPPLPPPLPPHMSVLQPFPFPPPGFAPFLLPPPFPVSIQKRNMEKNRTIQPPKPEMESRNLYMKTIPPKYNPPVDYSEEDNCVYHTLVNGDSEVLLRKILPIRMRGRTLVRTCISPIPDANDPRYNVVLQGGKKHSYGNVNLSMKF